jgi:predicted ATPase/class 3 adenylate cyclase
VGTTTHHALRRHWGTHPVSLATMESLPTGTVAFLMSDIEGSTRVVAAVGDAFARMLDEHFVLLDQAIKTQGGSVVSSEGDSIFAVFPSARLAVAAAVDGQRALAAHDWPPNAPIKVRMGIHAGEAVFGGRDYAGIDVHRAARITAAGWGGQILVSATVRDLVGKSLPEGIAFRDLGSHTLRDLPAPEHLYQVVVSGLAADFQPLRTSAPATPTNIPASLSRFIGRSRELAEVRALVDAERLVTLTGPGGTGKTRLSVESARTMLDRFPDGVWFVALDAVRDPQLMIPTIAQVLGAPEEPGRPIPATLTDRLADDVSLLVLDNLEQIVDAAPDLATLLRGTASLSILASSREPLSIEGERVYPVPPLAVPAESGRLRAADLQGSGSIELFVERARAARPDFNLTDENAPVIAAICRRLDGLPLAIELAAARLNVLAPNQILTRLNDRLRLLASSRRDLPDRQRTLRGTIDWSYELLSDSQRTVFRRLSVFAGGADIEAVQGVVDPESEIDQDVMELVSALVDRSLVRFSDEGNSARFAMLETIREYAAERLADSGETAELERRHAAYYAALAESARNVMRDPRRDELLDQLDRELGNLRAAIAWSLRTGQAESGLRITTALNDFWHLRNHIAEAVRALEDLVQASAADGITVLRGRALIIGAGLLTWLADSERSRPLAEAGIAIAEQLGDLAGMALGKSSLGWTIFYTDPQQALGVFQEGLAAARAVGDGALEMETLMGQAWTHLRLGDLDQASTFADQVIELGDRIGVAYITSFALLTRGVVSNARGEHTTALRHYGDALRRAHAAGAHVGTALALDAIAAAALDRGDVDRGVRLASAADRVRKDIGGNVTLGQVGLEEPLTRAKRMISAVPYERAVAKGRVLTVDQAVVMALQDVPN